MSNRLFPRKEGENALTRASRATVPVPLWVLVTLGILLLGVVLFAVLGHGMGGHMQMSIPQPGRYPL